MLLSCSLVDGIWRIILASDYSSLVSKLNASEAEWLATGAVSHDIKLLALFKFVSVTFIHVRRVCNRAAPAIVRSVEHVIVGAWYVEAPDFIRAVLCNELVVIYSMKRRPLPKKNLLKDWAATGITRPRVFSYKYWSSVFWHATHASRKSCLDLCFPLGLNSAKSGV